MDLGGVVASTNTPKTVRLGTRSGWMVLLRACGASAARFTSVEWPLYGMASGGQSTCQARNCSGVKRGWCLMSGTRASAR